MITLSYSCESCSSENYNKLLKMMIRLLHGQTGAPTGEQALLQQPTSPIRHAITMVRQLSWQPNPISIDLLHFRMALARRVMNSLFASIDSTYPAASSASIVPNVQLRLNQREFYRFRFLQVNRDVASYIRMSRMIRMTMMMNVRAPPPARLASFGLRSKRG